MTNDGKAAAGGQWWKAWVLLTSLGATVLGWMAFTAGDVPVESVVVAPEAPALPTEIAPATPRKPVFHAPVTRTRRS